MGEGARRIASVVLAAAVLSACSGGGGGGATTAPPAETPRSGLAGTLDTSYGAGGRVFFAEADFPTGDVAFSNDGTAYVATSAGVRKLDAAGNIVSTIPGRGKLAVDSLGNLYVAGEATVDKFDARGIVASFPTRDPSGDSSRVSAFVLQPSGGFYLVREGVRSGSSTPNVVTVDRFDAAAGHLATAFGSGSCCSPTEGVVDIVRSASSAYPTAAIADPAGNLFVAITVNFGDETVTTNVIALDATGNPVAGFSPSAPGSWTKGVCQSGGLSRDTRGGLIVSGSCRSASGVFQSFVARLNSNGTPATDFSPTGIRERVFGESGEAAALAIAVAPDGTVYVGGYTRSSTPGSCPSAVVAALGPSGPVPSFGTQGIATVAGTMVNQLMLDDQGRLYVGAVDLRSSNGSCGVSPPYQAYYLHRLK